jgi:hypothetical protein
VTSGICICGHEKHDGVCGKTRRGHESLPPTEPCDCAEFKAIVWVPCGAYWYYGMDTRPRKLGGY